MKLKHTMKTCILLTLCLTLLLGGACLLTGCNPQSSDSGDHGTTLIVCTNFPGYDFARSIVARYTENGGKGRVELKILGKPGQDMHSYEPSAQDIITLADADILICTGAEGWLDAALSSSGNRDVIRISMMESCDTIHADHDHEHDHGEDDCTLIGQDEHVWLSVENAARITLAIGDALKRADSENISSWETSVEQYHAELQALWGEYRDMMAAATRNTVVIADRYPFAYLFRDLGLDCVAAFPGCSSETSASFATQTMLIEKTREWGLSYIFVMEGSDRKVAQVVAAETGAEILTLNSMQVVTDQDITYTQIMKQNLESLKKALQ